MEPTRPLGVQWPSVRALKKIDEQRVYSVRRFSTTTSGDGDTMKWTEHTYGSGRGEEEVGGLALELKRKVLREERRRVEKRPLSRLQTDNGHSVQTRCRKTSRKLSDGSIYRPLQLGLHVSALRT